LRLVIGSELIEHDINWCRKHVINVLSKKQF